MMSKPAANDGSSGSRRAAAASELVQWPPGTMIGRHALTWASFKNHTPVLASLCDQSCADAHACWIDAVCSTALLTAINHTPTQLAWAPKRAAGTTPNWP